MTVEQKRDFLRRGFSRRNFGRLAAMISAGASLPFYNEPALAQLARLGPLPPDAVRINANENPLGPCKEAAEAIHDMVQKGGRYNYETSEVLAQTLAETEGIPLDHVMVFAGSSMPLHQSVLAFCSPSRGFVTGDPGYEAGERAAAWVGAKVSRVPLTKTYAHDAKAMAAADANAGLLYVCNPNNPTGTLTPKADIEWLLANKPAGSVLLVDEAYIHFSSAPAMLDQVARDKDIIVLRTFSKLYGMAGLRAGAAFARPELLDKLRHFNWGPLPVTAMVGATVSLKQKNLVAERRKYLTDIRNDVFNFLDRKRYAFIPSESNCFMLDTKRPGSEVIRGMAAQKVYIGRAWPSWPTHVRITVGTPQEMEKFKTALAKVLG